MYSNYVYVLNAEKFAMLLIRETLIAAHAGVEFGPSMEDAVEAYFGIKL